MAAYTRYYPSGTSAGAQLPAAWVNYIDSKLPDLIHAAGGTWAPSAQIILGGSGINVTGPAYLPDMRTAALQSGNSLTVQSGGNLNLSSGGNINANSGSHFYLYGTFHADGGDIALTSNSDITLASGSNAVIGNGADLEVESGGDINVASGGSLVMASGSDLTIGDITNVTAAAYTRNFRFTPAVTSGLVNFTKESSFATSQYWEQSNTTVNDHLSIGLPGLSEQATVKYVAVHLIGAAGHTWPVATVPRLLFGSVSAVTGAITTYSFTDDTSGSAAAYQAAHLITITGLSQSLSGIYPVVQLRGESGANALVGLKVFCIDVQVEYTAVECG